MRVFLPCILVLALACGPALAAHCETWSTSTTSSEQIVLDTGTNDAIVHYVAMDLCQFDCTFSIWVYREYNGIPGLQRHDASADASWSSLCCGGDEVVDDTCHGMIEADGFEL